MLVVCFFSLGWSFGGLVAVQTAHALRTHYPSIHVQGVLLLETVFPSTPQAGHYGTAWPGLAAIRSPAIREKVTKSIVQSVHLMDRWTPPPAASRWFEGLAVVLLRAKGWEGTDNENAARLNGIRKQRYLGWEDYDAEFVTSLMEVEGSHLSMFDDQNVSRCSMPRRSFCPSSISL